MPLAIAAALRTIDMASVYDDWQAECGDDRRRAEDGQLFLGIGSRGAMGLSRIAESGLRICVPGKTPPIRGAEESNERMARASGAILGGSSNSEFAFGSESMGGVKD